MGSKKMMIAVVVAVLIIFSSSLVTNISHAAASTTGLTIGLIGNPADPFNPITQIDLASGWVQSILYGRLVTYANNGSLVPYFADSYSISSNGLNYTFHLNPNLKWSDGTPITAHDVEFTLSAYIEYSTRVTSLLPLAVRTSNTVSGYKLNTSRVYIPNNTTISMNLAYPDPPLMAFFGQFFNIMPEHIDSGQNLSVNTYVNSHVVTSGPWYLASQADYKPGSYLILTANPYFFLGQPKVKKLTIEFFTTASAAEAALRTGSIQMLPEVAFSDASSLKSAGLTIVDVPVLREMFVQYNMNPKLADGSPNPLSNLTVREALGYATNITALVQSVSNGYFRPWGQAEMYGMYYLGYPAWNSSLPNVQFPYDPQKANQLLNESGYPWNGKSGTYRMNLTLITLATIPYFVSAVQILATEWAQIGVNLVVKLEQSTAWAYDSFSAPQPKTWNMDLYDLTEPPDPYYPVNFLFGPGLGNAGNFTNSEIRNLIYNVSSIATGQQRALVFQNIDSIANKYVPYLFLASETEIDAWSSNVNFTDGFNGLFTHPLDLFEVHYSEISRTVSAGISTLEIVAIAVAVIVVAAVVAGALYLRSKKKPKKQ
ncbi:MAG: ABC transporter substrate-binding protein [Candidatus Parvarchaeota archaeon]